MPKIIRLNEIGPVIAERFKDKNYVTCYASNNAATPTSAFRALTDYIKSGAKMPFMRMVSLLLLGKDEACSYDNVVVITENGIADLRGLGAGCKARALAHIADESVRDDLLRYIHDNPLMFIAPRHTKKISGFIPYDGPTKLDE